MYETLHYIGEVLLQGLLTCLLMFLLTRWYERKTALQKAKVAALFILLEIEEHYGVLRTVVKKKTFPEPDEDDFCFRSSNWKDFRKDLVPLLKYEDLKLLANYYKFINLMLSMTRHSESYHKHEALVARTINTAKYFCRLLGEIADDSNVQHILQEGSQG